MSPLRIAARRLSVAAASLQPARRKEWAVAMELEVSLIEDDRVALDFALGCLWAASQERFNPMKSIVTWGRWSVAAVTALYAGLHLVNAVNGLAILFGKADPFYDAMVAAHDRASAEVYAASVPWVMLYLAGMGVSSAAAAWFLVRWNARAFIASCVASAFFAGVMNAYGLWQTAQTGPSNMVWFWQFIPLSMLAGAAALFAWMSRRNDEALMA